LYLAKRFFYTEKYKELPPWNKYENDKNIELVDILHNTNNHPTEVFFPKENYKKIFEEDFLYKSLAINLYASIYRDQLSEQEVRDIFTEILKYEDVYYDYTRSYNSSHEFAYRELLSIEDDKKKRLYYSFEALDHAILHEDKWKQTQEKIISERKKAIMENFFLLLWEDHNEITGFTPKLVDELWQEWWDFVTSYASNQMDIDTVESMLAFIEINAHSSIGKEKGKEIFQQYIDRNSSPSWEDCEKLAKFLKDKWFQVNFSCPVVEREEDYSNENDNSIATSKKSESSSSSMFKNIPWNTYLLIVAVLIFVMLIGFVAYIFLGSKK